MNTTTGVVRGMDIPDKLLTIAVLSISISYMFAVVLLYMECCTAYLWLIIREFFSLLLALFDILETSHENDS